MYLILSFLLVLSIRCQEPETLSYDEWVDPNDPTSLRSTISQNDAAVVNTCQVGLEQDPSLRLILRRILQKLNVDASQRAFFARTARLSLSSYNMAVVAEYLESESSNNELGDREKVRSALHNMVELLEVDESYGTVLDSFVTFIRPWVSVLNMILLPSAFVFVLRNILSARSFWMTMIIVLVVISMITTYNRMYQEKLSARIAAAATMQGDACAPAGIIEQTLDVLSGLVSFRKKSNCLKFIESQTVSIVAEISLVDVFSNVVWNGLFGWLSALGPHLNKFYRELFDGIPFHAMLLIVVSMIFLFVRIKTPLFTIEPLFLSMVTSVCGAAITAVTSAELAPAVEQPSPVEPLRLRSRPATEPSNLAALPATPSSEHSHTRAGSLANVTKRTPERQRNLERRLAAERRENRKTGEKAALNEQQQKSKNTRKRRDLATEEDELSSTAAESSARSISSEESD